MEVSIELNEPAAVPPEIKLGTHRERCLGGPQIRWAGWATGPVWTGAEYLAPTGIRSQTVKPVASRYTD